MMETGCFVYKSNSLQLIHLQTSCRQTDLCANNLHSCMTSAQINKGIIDYRVNWCMERTHLQLFA